MTLAEVSTLLTREPPVAAGGIPVTQDLGAFPIRLRTIRSGWGSPDCTRHITGGPS